MFVGVEGEQLGCSRSQSFWQDGEYYGVSERTTRVINPPLSSGEQKKKGSHEDRSCLLMKAQLPSKVTVRQAPSLEINLGIEAIVVDQNPAHEGTYGGPTLLGLVSRKWRESPSNARVALNCNVPTSWLYWCIFRIADGGIPMERLSTVFILAVFAFTTIDPLGMNFN
ncbi:hypothetical protein BDZ91DRAFT_768157 [Kalaharituber pfeilii]|nr:hypothetical protein BDZ91DRAFT_768157 [Kalaharituber pfeilii]